MVSKVKVDAIESTTGSGTIALNNQFSGMTVASLPSTGSPPSIFAGGKVLQTIHGSTTSQVVITSDNTWTDAGVTATITPSSTSNTVLIMITQSLQVYNSSSNRALAGMRLLRGSTVIVNSTGDSSGPYGFESDAGGVSSIYTSGYYAVTYVDSPGSTSAITYKTQGAKRNGTAVKINGEGYNATPSNARGSIVLMELAPN